MTFKFLKKKFLILVIIILMVVPVVSFATGVGTAVPGLPFGGLVIFTLPCSCSANLWVFFAPLHIVGKTIAGPIIYQPGYTTLYANLAIGVPSTWHLGSYIPLVGNGVCWQYVGTACAVMKNYGLMNKTGTGLP